MQQTSTVNFRNLYQMAKYAGILMIVIIILQIIVFTISPPPDTVQGFFALYHQNSIIGLLSLDFLYLINNLLLVFLYLGIAAILYRENPSLVFPALMLGLIGIGCYYPSNPAFEMLILSNQYYLATPVFQPQYLAAGEMLLAGYTGTSFNAYYVMSTLSLMLFSYALLKSNTLPRKVGLFGLIAGILMIIPSSAGLLGMIFSLLSLIPWTVFVILIVMCFHHRISAPAEITG
jgi:Domain of unknown function (DUF4386)